MARGSRGAWPGAIGHRVTRWVHCPQSLPSGPVRRARGSGGKRAEVRVETLHPLRGALGSWGAEAPWLCPAGSGLRVPRKTLAGLGKEQTRPRLPGTRPDSIPTLRRGNPCPGRSPRHTVSNRVGTGTSSVVFLLFLLIPESLPPPLLVSGADKRSRLPPAFPRAEGCVGQPPATRSTGLSVDFNPEGTGGDRRAAPTQPGVKADHGSPCQADL